MRQLFIDSRDRVSGTSTDFTIQLPETLTIEGGNHKARIDNLRIPLTIPTIRSNWNDNFVVLLGGTSYSLFLPQANYDGPTLAATLQGVLQSNCPGAWVCNYDTTNISMRLSCSNPFTLTAGSFVNQLKTYPYTQTSTSYVFSYVSVLGIDVMYLSSPQFSTLDTVGPGGAHDTLMCAVVNQPYGSVLDVSMPQASHFNVPAMTTQTLSFTLRDRFYNVLSIVPNISFVMLIE